MEDLVTLSKDDVDIIHQFYDQYGLTISKDFQDSIDAYQADCNIDTYNNFRNNLCYSLVVNFKDLPADHELVTTGFTQITQLCSTYKPAQDIAFLEGVREAFEELDEAEAKDKE